MGKAVTIDGHGSFSFSLPLFASQAFSFFPLPLNQFQLFLSPNPFSLDFPANTMEAVGEALLSPALGFLLQKLASCELIGFSRGKNFLTELEKWRNELMSIQEELNDAEQKQITRVDVKKWLFDLRDLAYDMEDVLGEFDYQAMRRELMREEAGASGSKIRELATSCVIRFNPTHVVRNVKMGPRIKEITVRLQDISARKVRLGLEKIAAAEPVPTARQRSLSATATDEPDVYGRDEDKKAILGFLAKDDDTYGSNFGVISIVGIGGLGKTTLAWQIYKVEKAAGNFEPVLWVCVSDVFDVEKITKEILNSAGSSESAVPTTNFQQVQAKLTQKLRGKRFLLFLDDVWNRDYGDWCSLRAPFSAGRKGSKVIVTTRNREVALMMGAEENVYDLKSLSEDDCWSVFAKHAFEHRNIEDHQNLVSIGRKVIGKCGGLPLAAKALAGLLRSKQTEEEWERVCNSKFWDLSVCEIIPALHLSYHYLPSHLKRCFAYCAIFPKDYEFDSKTLVLLWMAEGLIQQPNNHNVTMEDEGDCYFHELLSRSFFQRSGNQEARFVMHDLISDLAQFVSDKICFCLEDNLESNQPSTIVKRARHSSFIRGKFDVVKRFQAFQELQHLRTFVALPIYPKFSESFVSKLVCNRLVSELRHLRVLSLSEYMIYELPDSVGELKHLRYLNLSLTQIKLLPDSVTSLYNLQTLILSNCAYLTRLPSNIGNLISLRHLNVAGCSLQEMPLQIGRLTNLQTLSDVIVGQNRFLGIKELKNLPHLRGELCISKLENVMHVQDARDANLKTMLHIEKLSMIWSKESTILQDRDTEMEILLSLKPHTNLKELRIEYYGGGNFPNWVCDLSYSKLVVLSLIGCTRCVSLPSVGELPFLRKLEIKRMDSVSSVGLEFEGQVSQHAKPFQCLESLRFDDMKVWEKWCWSTESFSCLHELEIKNCPRLTEKVPAHLNSLVELNIENCPELLQCFFQDALVLRNLAHLQIMDCDQVVSLGEEEEHRVPHSLQRLEICKLNKLEKLPHGLQNYTSLAELMIHDCPKLVSFPANGFPLMLRGLAISKCESLSSLPGRMTMSHLNYLEIEGCPSLTCFPKEPLPATLKRLLICDCKDLVSLPEDIDVSGLEQLIIERCPSLTCFPKDNLSPTLMKLWIWGCEKLESLPEGITNCDSSNTANSGLQLLDISLCPSLQSFPTGNILSNLKSITIRDCAKLQPISDEMLHSSSNALETLCIENQPTLRAIPYFLYNLKDLRIEKCENLQELRPHLLRNFTCLTSLKITCCENIRMPLSEWGLAGLTCLKTLAFSDYHHHHGRRHVPQSLVLPTTLFGLSISRFQNVESLTFLSLQRLNSLKSLSISECPKLRSFFPKEGLSDMLSELCISNCPLLTQRCSNERGKDWPKIAHIPCIKLDDRYILEQ